MRYTLPHSPTGRGLRIENFNRITAADRIVRPTAKKSARCRQSPSLNNHRRHKPANQNHESPEWARIFRINARKDGLFLMSSLVVRFASILRSCFFQPFTKEPPYAVVRSPAGEVYQRPYPVQRTGIQKLFHQSLSGYKLFLQHLPR